MAASGSNAPLINDALVAWPPPPSTARFGASPPQRTSRYMSPLASPAVPSFANTALPAKYSPVGNDHHTPKGKERAGLSVDIGGDSEPKWQRPDYPPPRRPLTPAQLGRIAQSFGIAIPNMPDAAGMQPSRSRSPMPRSPSSPAPPQHMVAVIPPPVLLPPAEGLNQAAERDRLRRFRRGRLLPLQPTLGAMLVTLAREFGLPSTTGIHVYLGANGGRGSTDSSGDDEDSGPLVTASTWTTLFAHAAKTNAPSPSSTPSSTPRKPSRASARQTFGASAGSSFGSSHLSSPLTSVSESVARTAPNGQDAVLSKSRSSQGSSSASSFSPRTPGMSTALPLSLPVFGTIEFEIDPSEARWLDSWLRAGGPLRRQEGVRELTLVERLKDARPQFVRQMEEEAGREEARVREESRASKAEANAREASSRAEKQRQEDEQKQLDEQKRHREDLAHNAELLRRAQAASKLDKSRQTALPTPASTASPEIEQGYEQLDGSDGSDYGEEAALDDDAFARDALNADMLASMDDPMNDIAAMHRDRVESAPRSLSPSIRDIGTERALNGPLAHDDDKVDEPKEQLAEVVAMLDDKQDKLASPITLPRSSAASHTSPRLALTQLKLDDDQRGSGMLMADQITDLEKMMRDLSPRELHFSTLPTRGDSLSTGGAIGGLPPRGTSRLPYLQPETVSSPLGMRSVSAPNPKEPDSPKRTVGYNDFSPDSQRSVSAKIPSRPQRPPTPDLTTPELPKHHLSQDMVDTIKSYPSPMDNRASLSLRGIRRRVSTSIKPGATLQPQSHSPDQRPPSAYVPTSRQPRPDSTVRTSRFFNFPKRNRDSIVERPGTITHISSPFATSHKHIPVSEMAANGIAAGIFPTDEAPTHPASPDSPRHVRRKPVPGMGVSSASSTES